MKKRRRTKRGTMRAIRLWTYPEANKALPYLRSIANSLREHWLEMQSLQLAVKRLDDARNPTRRELIALEEARKDVGTAEDNFETALAELMQNDVFLLDPVKGLSLIPFQEGDELAWYVLDLFDQDGLTSWRFHKDPLETRRPMPKAEAPTLATAAQA